MIATYGRIKQQRAEREKDGGFTLIELLIVIVVLGILAAIVVFSLGTITGKSAVAACEADAQQANTAIAAYYAANNGAYPTSNIVMIPNYLQTWPSNTTHYKVVYVGGGAAYTLTVTDPTGTTPALVSGTSGTVLGAVVACSTPGLVV